MALPPPGNDLSLMVCIKLPIKQPQDDDDFETESETQFQELKDMINRLEA